VTDRYGCYNAERRSHYYVQTREYNADWTYKLVTEIIADVMSDRCEWSKSHQSDKCEGCKWQRPIQLPDN